MADLQETSNKPEIFTVNKVFRKEENSFARTTPNPPIGSSNEDNEELLRNSLDVPISPVLYFNKERDFLYLSPLYIDYIASLLHEPDSECLVELRQFQNICLYLEHGVKKLQHERSSYQRRHIFSLFPNLKSIMVISFDFGRLPHELKFEELAELDRTSNQNWPELAREVEWKDAVESDYKLNWEAPSGIKEALTGQKEALGGKAPVVKVMLLPLKT